MLVLRIFFSAMVVRAWWDVGFFFKEGIALLEEEALGFFIEEEEEAVVFLLEVMFLAPGYALLDFLLCCFVDAGIFLEEILLEDIFLAILFFAILFLAILFLAMFFFATGFMLLLLFFMLSLETVLAILMQV